MEITQPAGLPAGAPLPPGIIVKPSIYPVHETMDHIQDFLVKHGVTIYARINQQEQVAMAGLKMLPLEYLLFGNPKGGGPVMEENPLAAIDLPLKVIAWEDAQQKVWLAYNSVAYVQQRFGLSDAVSGPLNFDLVVGKIFNG